MKVLVVEDSLVVRTYVRALLDAEPDIDVIETGNGDEALALARSEAPDVILCDLQLPGLHGLDLIRMIMSEKPRPIVVLSAHLQDSDKDMAFEAIEAGAVDVMAKPAGLDEMQQERFQRALLRTVRLMATVPVVSRRRAKLEPVARELPSLSEDIEIIAIGASTGGPPLLQQMFMAWPVSLSVPVLLVQHIVPGFEDNFARWLSGSGHDVRVAEHGEIIAPGRVYVAPGSADLRVEASQTLCLTPHAQTHGKATSVDALFESVALHYGSRAWGVLLTGMGQDGAAGLLQMRERGAFTIVQDSASSVIDGMPAAARRLGAASTVMKPEEICAAIQARF